MQDFAAVRCASDGAVLMSISFIPNEFMAEIRFENICAVQRMRTENGCFCPAANTKLPSSMFLILPVGQKIDFKYLLCYWPRPDKKAKLYVLGQEWPKRKYIKK